MKIKNEPKKLLFNFLHDFCNHDRIDYYCSLFNCCIGGEFMMIFRFLKRLFCRHEWEWEEREDKIVWFCRKCGRE